MKDYHIWFKLDGVESLQAITLSGENESYIREKLKAMSQPVLVTDKGVTNERMLEMYQQANAQI